MAIDMEDIALLLLLQDKKKAARKEMDEAEAAIKGIQDNLVNQFVNDDIQSIKHNGRTIYIHRQIWAKKLADTDACCAALRKSKLGDYVKEGFSNASLSAYFRELDKEDKPLPKLLKGVLDISEVISIRSRKA